MNKININPGDKYGKLILIKKLFKDKFKRYHWECVCDCGKIISASQPELRNGRTISCGCVRRKSPGTASYHSLFLDYQNGAKRRCHLFKLTKEEFIEIITKNCFYCNKEPSLFNSYLKKDMKTPCHNGVSPDGVERNTVRVNGLDRVDNSLGYELNNVVSCCKECNSMKSVLNKKEFLDLVRKICYYQDSK